MADTNSELNAGSQTGESTTETPSTVTAPSYDSLVEASSCTEYQHYDFEDGTLKKLNEYVNDTFNGDNSVNNPELPTRSMRDIEKIDEVESYNGYRSQKMLGDNTEELTDQEVYDEAAHASTKIKFIADDFILFLGSTTKFEVIQEPIYANLPELVWSVENEDLENPALGVFADGSVVAVNPGKAKLIAYAIDNSTVADKNGVKRKVNKFSEVKAQANVTVVNQNAAPSAQNPSNNQQQTGGDTDTEANATGSGN